MKMDGDRLIRKIFTWSESLAAGENFKNWAWKARKLLGDIRDFGGLLLMDELLGCLSIRGDDHEPMEGYSDDDTTGQ